MLPKHLSDECIADIASLIVCLRLQRGVEVLGDGV
jgi:hypothetical protein